MNAIEDSFKSEHFDWGAFPVKVSPKRDIDAALLFSTKAKEFWNGNGFVIIVTAIAVVRPHHLWLVFTIVT